MASVPTSPNAVAGRVDRQGRLIEADPALAELQRQAGAQLGGRLALPQVAAIARLARELGVPVSRAATAAGDRGDYDLWVRAVPVADEVHLSIDGWTLRPPTGPRFDVGLSGDSTAGDDVARAGRWTTDAELRITTLTPDLADRFGVGFALAIGQPLTRFLRFEQQEDGSLPILDALAARASFRAQPASLRAQEAPPLLLSAEATRDPAGQFTGFDGHARLQASPPALVDYPADEVSATGSDLERMLRTPLDRIIAAADRIVERADGPLRGDYASYANDIATAGRHLRGVVRAMSEGAAASLAERIDLLAAASEAVALLASTGQSKRIAVDLVAQSRIEARGNRRGIVQIVVNILGNAIRHSPTDGVVTVTLAARDGRALLTIADQGPGIAAEDQKRIFERFERLGARDPGSGLGLAIARRLAEDMAGTIHLDSAPGHGARFTLDLPLA